MLFAKRLANARKRLGLTTKELADKIGVSRSYISLLENYNRLPGKSILPKIASALGVKKTTITDWYLKTLEEKLK